MSGNCVTMMSGNVLFMLHECQLHISNFVKFLCAVTIIQECGIP